MFRPRFACPKPGCNQTFSRQSDCTRHVDEKHGDPKPCPVPGCKWKKAKRKGRLEAHLKKHHSDIYNVELDATALSDSGQPSSSNYDPIRPSYEPSSEAISASSIYPGTSTYSATTTYPTSSTYGSQYTTATTSYYQPTTSSPTYSIGYQLPGGREIAAPVMQKTYATVDGQAGYTTAEPSNDQQYQDNYTWSSESIPPA